MVRRVSHATLKGGRAHDTLQLLVGVDALVELPDLGAGRILEHGAPGVVQHGRVSGRLVRGQLRDERVARLHVYVGLGSALTSH